jgi:hypothetical protein
MIAASARKANGKNAGHQARPLSDLGGLFTVIADVATSCLGFSGKKMHSAGVAAPG